MTFALKAKRAIKRVAAVGVGLAMLGTTMAGAVALSYTLGDYPEPFIKDGQYNKVAYVTGEGSSNEDTLALTSLTNKLATLVPEEEEEETVTTVEGGTEADVPLGKPIVSSTGNEFDLTLEDDDIETLFDGEITYRGSNYDVSEVIVIGANETRSVIPQTSLTSSDDDYESDVFLEVQRDAIKYFYSFDESINLSQVSTTYPLEIEFLGKKLTITNVYSTGDKIDAQVGEEFFLNAGESVVVEGKTVTLTNVGSSSVVVDVDGKTEVIADGSTETVNGIEIYVDDVFSRDELSESSAVLIIGEEATETYRDGDAYMGEDEDDPDWVWNIAGLYTSTTTSIINNASSGITESGLILGIENDFVKDDDSDDPVGVGECYTMPNNFISICFDSLTVDDDEYMTFVAEIDKSADLSESGLGSTLTSEPTVYIHVSDSEGLQLDTSELNTANGTQSDHKTDKIWLWKKENTVDNVTYVFYEDSDGKTQYFGNISSGATKAIAKINYQDVKGTDMRIVVQNPADGNSGGNFVSIVPYDSTDLTDGSDDINMTFNLSSGKFNSLGSSASSEEAAELIWNGNNIGTKDEDHRSKFGIIIYDPKSHGASDEVELGIPADIVEAKIEIGGSKTEVSGGGSGSTAPTPMKADELTNPSAWNLITVGGPCVNSITADLLGVSYPSCGAASGIEPDTAIIELLDNGANTALVVAGWEGIDTRRAGIVLANYDDDTIAAALAGKTSVKVTGTSLEVSGITVE